MNNWNKIYPRNAKEGDFCVMVSALTGEWEPFFFTLPVYKLKRRKSKVKENPPPLNTLKTKMVLKVTRYSGQNKKVIIRFLDLINQGSLDITTLPKKVLFPNLSEILICYYENLSETARERINALLSEVTL